MTTTQHVVRAEMVIPSYNRPTSDTPVFVDTLQGPLTGWSGTFTRTFNDATHRFEIRADDVTISRNAVPTTVGGRYRLVVHGYAAAAGVRWLIYASGTGGTPILPAATRPTEITYDFVATSSSTDLVLVSDRGAVYWTDVAVYATEPASVLDLHPTDATVTLDESWSPFVQASLTCKIPVTDALPRIDPRATPPPRVSLELEQIGGQAMTAADFTAMLGATGATRVNRMPYPRRANGWTLGTGEVGDLQDVTTGGPHGVGGFTRWIVSTPATGGSPGWSWSSFDAPSTIVTGSVVQGSVYVRSTAAARVTLRADVIMTSTSATVAVAVSPAVDVVPNTWTRLTVTTPATTATADRVDLRVTFLSPFLPADAVVDATQAQGEVVASGAVPFGDYFDGAIGTPGRPAGFPVWTGTAMASSSRKTFGAATAAALTGKFAGLTAAYLTDLFQDQYNPTADPTLNVRRPMNLHLRGREVDRVAGTMTLTLASDEMLLQDYRRPTDDPVFTPPATTDLAALVTWALSTARLGVLEPGYSTAPIVATDISWDLGDDLWSLLDPFVQGAGLRLWCDETRRWFLAPPFDGTSGTVALPALVELAETLTRDGQWGDAVAIRSMWVNPATGNTGVSTSGAYRPGFSKTVLIERRAKAGNAGSSEMLKRSRTRGFTVTAAAVNDYAAYPGKTARLSTAGTAYPDLLLSSVAFTWPGDEMTITTREIPTD